MPLLVHCPQGCQIRVPISRAGRIVRCPECKSAIRIAQVDIESLTRNELIPCSAKLAKRKTAPGEAEEKESAPPATRAKVAETTQAIQTQDVQPEDIAAARRESSKSLPDPHGPVESSPPRSNMPTDVSEPVTDTGATGASSAERGDSADQEGATGVSGDSLHELDPGIQKVVQTPPRVPPVLQTRPWRNVQPLKTVKPDVDIKPIDLEVGSSNPSPEPVSESAPETRVQEMGDVGPTQAGNSLPQAPSITTAPVINIALDSETSEQLDAADWRQRLEEANSDRKVLSRLLAFFLMLLAVVNIAPAIYHWQSWSMLEEVVPLPRWIYLQIFVGAIYLVYSMFLVQVADWSALRSISVALLVMAFCFGVVSTGLLVGSDGIMAGSLGIPFALVREAGIWCVAMLLLATVMSYWAGKESSNWRRSEEVLKDILRPDSAA